MEFREVLEIMEDIYNKKNADYGNSFEKSYEEFGLVAPIIRLQDKINRVKNLIMEEQQVADESLKDTFLDIANYAAMTYAILQNEPKEKCLKIWEVMKGVQV